MSGRRCKHPYHAERYRHTKRRLGRQRAPKVAQIDLSRRLTEAIWHMLTRNSPSLRQAPLSSSRLTAHFGNAPPDEPLRFSQIPANRRGERDMSTARDPQSARGPYLRSTDPVDSPPPRDDEAAVQRRAVPSARLGLKSTTASHGYEQSAPRYRFPRMHE
jgi:hypothetical protein